MMTPTSRSEAIFTAGQMVAAARAEMAQVYAAGGAEALARRACPDGSPEEIERLTRIAEQWWMQRRR